MMQVTEDVVGRNDALVRQPAVDDLHRLQMPILHVVAVKDEGLLLHAVRRGHVRQLTQHARRLVADLAPGGTLGCWAGDNHDFTTTQRLGQRTQLPASADDCCQALDGCGR